MAEKDLVADPALLRLLAEDACWQAAVLSWWLRKPDLWQARARHAWRREGRQLWVERRALWAAADEIVGAAD
ncbi:hypothetical protein [Streptomyces flavofungini]|uniref:hypothetical protein n=1 Tax=Streptomyces flavofungini TaxID=68200 RepID=UPI0025AF7DF8|nr:hypothetical protein [Streptomyces flavofungini]WJV44743.1 hypothetical protein QUY26_03885 [Streptomyces flavofungini]